MAIVFELAKHFGFLLLHCLDELVRFGGPGFTNSSPLLTILLSRKHESVWIVPVVNFGSKIPSAIAPGRRPSVLSSVKYGGPI